MNAHPSIVLSLAALMLAVSPAAAANNWGDRPLQITQSIDAHFPAALTMQGITEGEVRVVLNVDADSQLVDCLVLAYTHPELVTELLNALREWHYQAAYQRGEPTGSRAEVAFSFQARGAVLSMTPIEDFTANFNRMSGTRPISLVCSVDELDKPLETVELVQPRHPRSALRPNLADGRVLLDFYIDSEGRPRMPVVIRMSHEAFAVAAVQALGQWRYAPPTRDGRKVAVRVRQEFVFPKPS